MEAKFRPIPLTILDLLGIIVPGLTWLLLGVMTYNLFINSKSAVLTVPASWEALSTLLSQGGDWLGSMSLLFATILIGQIIKPLAMPIGGYLSRILFKAIPDTRKCSWRRMYFPFDCRFQGEIYYLKANDVLTTITGLERPQEYPRTGLFSAAKRYLRVFAPTLWEESERMEAEIRMMGSIFLATIYYLTLNLAFLALHPASPRTLFWLGFSLAACIITGIGFNRLRLREVAYTYINVLLAQGVYAVKRNEQDAGPQSAVEKK